LGEAIIAWWFLRLGRRAIRSRWGRVVLYAVTGLGFAAGIVTLLVVVNFSVP
jgi:hypothetical protein